MSRSLPLYPFPNGGEKLGATDIDSLQIQINAEASRANDAIDRLCSKLGKLETSLNGIGKSSFGGVTSGLRSLNSSLKEISNVRVDNLSKIATSVKKISSIDAFGLTNTSKSIRDLSNGLRDIGRVHVDTKNIVDIANAMSMLGRKKSFDGTANLAKSKQDIIDFVTGLNSVGTLSFDFSGVSNLVANMQKLGSKSVTQATTNLRPMKEQLLQFVSGLNGIGKLNFDATNLAALVSSLSKMGGKSVSQSITNIPLLAKALKDLMEQLSTAPKVSQNLIDMTTALGNLARTGSSSGRAVSSLSGALNTYSKSTKTAKTHSFSLASAIGKVYATYWMLFRVFGKIREAINISSDLTEVQNVVNTVFGDMTGKVEELGKTSIEQFGMSELSLKQFSSRFQAMGVNAGVSAAQISKANEFLNKQTNGYVGLSDSMADVSLNLTKLTADMASFYNVDQSDVAQDLESVFTGQTRPLRTYGLDLTEATLKEWAMKNGLDANVESMTQAEKVLLRYQYVMERTGAAQNDFADTATTWANQVRILKQNFEALGATLGGSLINALKPIVIALNAVIGKLREFATVVSNSLGVIFGWKYEDIGGGVSGDFEDAEDASSGISDNLGSAAANAKKLKSHLLSIDELNVVEPDSESGSGGSGGSGSGSASGVLSGGNWVQTGGLFKDYESNLDALYKLGDYIGATLTKALNGIDWQGVYEGAKNFGKGLADFLNGLISPDLFGAVGKTIAGALNTALKAAFAFADTFEFDELGLSIAKGINSFFATFEFGELADTIDKWVQGLFKTLKTAISEIKWGDIYDSIIGGLENLDIETIAIVLGTISIKKIAGAHLASGALSIIGGSLSKQIAGSIAARLGVEIGANAGIATALSKGLTTALAGSGMAFVAGVKTLFGSSAAASALTFIDPVAKAIAGIGSIVAGATLSVTNFFSMWKKGFSWLKEALMVLGIALTAVGAVILGVSAAPAAIVAAVVAAASTAAIVIHDNWDAIKEWASEIPDFFGEKFESAKDSIEEAFRPLTSWFHDKWASIKNIFKDVKKFFKSGFEDAAKAVKGAFSGIGKFFKDTAKDIFEPIKKAVNGIISGINWVLSKLGSKNRFDPWSGVKFANGSDGIRQDTIGMVNDQSGSTYKEMIIPPHGEPFIPNGRNVLLPLEKGTKIMPANQTKAFMNASGIPKFKNGIGNFFSGAWASIKDFTGNVLDYITNPGKLIKIAIDKFVDATGWAGAIGDMAGGVINKVFDTAVDFIKGQFGTSTTYKPGAGVEQWRSLATRALQLTGHYSDSNLAALLAQMSHESGGNPNAINNWDINAKNGTPSKGLMQVIDPTFRTYAMPPYNTNIYDPLSNMIASIRYTVSRYGSLYKGWTARGYKGYASGIGKIGFADLIPAYVNGGFPEDGLFYANHNELVGQFSNGDTAVANNDQIVAGIKAGVKEAVAEVLAPYLRDIRDNTRETADKDFTTRIDTRTLVSEYNSRSKRNGFSFT